MKRVRIEHDGRAIDATPCAWDGSDYATNRKQDGAQAFYFVNRYHDHLFLASHGKAPRHHVSLVIDGDHIRTIQDEKKSAAKNATLFGSFLRVD